MTHAFDTRITQKYIGDLATLVKIGPVKGPKTRSDRKALTRSMAYNAVTNLESEIAEITGVVDPYYDVRVSMRPIDIDELDDKVDLLIKELGTGHSIKAHFKERFDENQIVVITFCNCRIVLPIDRVEYLRPFAQTTLAKELMLMPVLDRQGNELDKLALQVIPVSSGPNADKAIQIVHRSAKSHTHAITLMETNIAAFFQGYCHHKRLYSEGTIKRLNSSFSHTAVALADSCSYDPTTGQVTNPFAKQQDSMAARCEQRGFSITNIGQVVNDQARKDQDTAIATRLCENMNLHDGGNG
jgi:hypothetical protein